MNIVVLLLEGKETQRPVSICFKTPKSNRWHTAMVFVLFLSSFETRTSGHFYLTTYDEAEFTYTKTLPPKKKKCTDTLFLDVSLGTLVSHRPHAKL